MADNQQTNINYTGDSWYYFNQRGVSATTDTTTLTTSPSAARLAASGLLAGAVNAVKSSLQINFAYDDGTAIASEDDWRVRVSCSEDMFEHLYGGPLTVPLRPGRGVIFPYTPQVTVQHTARYGSQPLTHSNYASYFYEGSEVAAITINGDFTVQNAAEGQYLLAALYFFRSATKMFFGQDQLAGNPPPLLFLDGYGDSYLPHVPCVLTSLTHTMPSDVDYVEFPVDTSLMRYINQTFIPPGSKPIVNITRLPTSSQIQITLQPVYSRANIHNNFTLQGFAQGNLLGGSRTPSGIPGGFI